MCGFYKGVVTQGLNVRGGEVKCVGLGKREVGEIFPLSKSNPFSIFPLVSMSQALIG